MKKSKLRRWLISLIVILATALVGMLGYSLTVTNGWSVKENHYKVTLKQLSTMMSENLKENGKDVDLLFKEDESAKFSFATYIPKNATKENPAPVIIGCHGYNNSKEQQFPNITEFTKRGFVVVVPDLGGHGRSDVSVNQSTTDASGMVATEGVLAAVNYAMTMSCVDNSAIGIIGHSAGDLDAINTISIVNVEGAKNRISAFFCPTGTISALFAGRQKDLILGVAAGKYDELDTHFFNSSDFMNSPLATMMVKRVYPEFTGPVVEGQWYTSAGAVESPKPGEKLGVTDAVIIHNPAITHVGGTFSLKVEKLAIEFFYAAFGTPTGAKFVSSKSQTWPIAAACQLLGLLSFFASAFVIGGILLTLPSSKKVANAAITDEGVVIDNLCEKETPKELPSIKSWKEIVPLLVTFIPLFILPFIFYYRCYNDASRLFGSAYSAPNVNGIAWFTLFTGICSFVLLLVNWGVRKLCHLKDGVKVESPFTPAKISNFSQIAKVALFSLLVVFLMYIPQFISYKVFHMNYAISVYTVGLPRYEWLPTIFLKYLPMWIVFMVANSLLNVNCRYKEIPEWGTTLFITVANLLPIVIMLIINYTTLVKTGQTYYTFGDPSIMLWNLIGPMLLVGVLGRFYYKKTGNIWTGTFITALVLTLMAVTITRHTTGAMFPF